MLSSYLKALLIHARRRLPKTELHRLGLVFGTGDVAGMWTSILLPADRLQPAPAGKYQNTFPEDNPSFMTHFPGASLGCLGSESNQACGQAPPVPSRGAPPQTLQPCLGRTPWAGWVRGDLALALHHHEPCRHRNSPVAAPRSLSPSDCESVHTWRSVCTASQAG